MILKILETLIFCSYLQVLHWLYLGPVWGGKILLTKMITDKISWPKIALTYKFTCMFSWA